MITLMQNLKAASPLWRSFLVLIIDLRSTAHWLYFVKMFREDRSAADVVFFIHLAEWSVFTWWFLNQRFNFPCFQLRTHLLRTISFYYLVRNSQLGLSAVYRSLYARNLSQVY
jgi:hypothetical protein